MFQRLRMHLAAVDASPGSGLTPATVASAVEAAQAAPAPAAPAAAPANGAAAPQVDVNALVQQISNGVFANLRRAGVLGSEDKKPGKAQSAGDGGAHAQPDPAPTAPPASADQITRLRSLDRAVRTVNVTERPEERMERAFLAESPHDVSTWVASYLDETGLRGSTAPTAPAATPAPNPSPAAPPPQPNNAVPVTAGGSPPPPTAPIELRDLLSLSKADVDEILRTKGPKWLSQEFAKQMRGKRFSTAE